MKNLNRTADTKVNIKKMTALAMFSALAYICVFIFKLQFAGFLTFDAKDSIMTVAGMFFGPLAALAISFVVSFAEFLTISGTGVYGLIMNFAASAAFTVTASLIYKYRRKMSGAVIGLVSSVLMMTAVMLAMNLAITPYYMGVPLEDVAKMIPTVLLPFNLVKATFNASLVLLLYKPLTNAMKSVHLVERKAQAAPSEKKTTILSTIIAAAILVVSLLIFFLALGGSISLGK